MCSRVAGASAGRLHLVGAWPAAFTLLVDGLQVNLVAVHLQGLGESVVWRIFVAWKSQASGSPFFFSILGATTTFRIGQGIPHNGHAWYVVNFPVCCIYIAEAAFGYCREPKTTCVD
uniref:Uncharacterized protein n=1 Tax=Opuntia streptacantha TaxID=393608 RepID=A0A7C8ZKS0_OPUST